MAPCMLRSACGLLLALRVVSADSALVEWSANRKLTRSDFKSTAPLPRGIAALSFVAIETSWACEDGTFDSQIRAVFDPGRSGWRSAISNVLDASNARPSLT